MSAKGAEAGVPGSGGENDGGREAATASQARPVYRFWSPALSRHFYTIDESERDKLAGTYADTWNYEGIAFYAYPARSQPRGAVPVYRFWSDALGRHFYTESDRERDGLINGGSDTWAYEGIAWYALPETAAFGVDSVAAKDESYEAAGQAGVSTVVDESDGSVALAQVLRVLKEQWQSELPFVRVEGPLAEINRATKVVIRDLDYSFFRDGRLDLGVKCRSAVVSMSDAEVVLRGGVAISAADGAKLVSNCVRWDVEKNCFSVPGTYVLNRGGTLVRGRGLHCDHRLIVLVARNAYSRKGEDRWTGDLSF